MFKDGIIALLGYPSKPEKKATIYRVFDIISLIMENGFAQPERGFWMQLLITKTGSVLCLMPLIGR